MKKLILFIALTIGLSVFAQSKIDYSGRTLSGSPDETITAIVEMSGPDSDFGGYEADVTSRIGNILIVSFKAGDLEKISELPQVKSIKLSTEVNLLGTSVESAPEKANVMQGAKVVGDKKPKATKKGHKGTKQCCCCGCCAQGGKKHK